MLSYEVEVHEKLWTRNESIGGVAVREAMLPSQ